jgi:ribosomal-protein-alanine N-acetyltransferase
MKIQEAPPKMNEQIETKRLVLEIVSGKDVESIARLADNPKIALYISPKGGSFPSPYTLEDAKKYVEFSQTAHKNGSEHNFSIRTKEGNFVGLVGVVRDNQGVMYKLGYWLGEEYWHQGYGKESAEALVDWTFQKTNAQKIEAYVYEPNEGSRKLLESIGFKQEGFKEDCFVLRDDRLVGEYLFGLTKKAYANRN